MPAELAAFLEDVLRRPGAPAALHLLGGAAVVAAYGGRRCSPQLDVPPAEAPEWAREGSGLERKHGLCLRPAAALLPPDWRRRRRGVAGVLSGRVFAAAPEDLIISKAARYQDADRADIAALFDAGVDRLELIRRFRLARRLYKGDLRVLDRAFNAVLREHLGLGPFLF